MDLSLQEKAERIRQWIRWERNGFRRLDAQLMIVRGYGVTKGYMRHILRDPDCFPKQINNYADAIATLKLIGE